MSSSYKALEYRRKEHVLILLDQTALPWEEVYLELKNSREIAEAIKSLRVRGAPMIGVAAAFGFVASVAHGEDPAQVYELLRSTRPTAVNLFKALDRVYGAYKKGGLSLALEEAYLIEAEERERSYSMMNHGAEYLKKLYQEKGKKLVVMTHCNTGALAAPGMGTAFGVIVQSYRMYMVEKVIVNKTDPLQQGARLTMWELYKHDVPAILVPDTATTFAVKNFSVDVAVVGADRITMNGDFANKIGTYQVALAVKKHGGRVVVVAPTSTWDENLNSGEEIPIEERPAEEVLWYRGKVLPIEEEKVWNPAFDVTPAELVDAYVSEKGVWTSPQEFDI